MEVRNASAALRAEAFERVAPVGGAVWGVHRCVLAGQSVSLGRTVRVYSFTLLPVHSLLCAYC